MVSLRPGFYLVQNDYCGEHREVPRPKETMSIIEFLRRVRRRKEIPKEVCVVGLDKFIADAFDKRKAANIVLDTLILAQRTRHLARPARVIVMPVGYLELSTHWKVGCLVGEEAFNARWVFPHADIEIINEYPVCYSSI